jgi:hypothetical protein
MLNNVILLFTRSAMILLLSLLWIPGHAHVPPHLTSPITLTTDPPHYDFSFEAMDQMLQLIEKHRNAKAFHATLEYGVMFYPETDLITNELVLIAKACVIFPYEAVPLNLPGNHFPGALQGSEFFDEEFLKTFKQSPALANGAKQAYTFAVLYENQVQILLSQPKLAGVKAYQAVVDYALQVPPATTSTYYNLHIVADVPGKTMGEGLLFFLAVPCPPWWRI